ncbi:hypothetical protein JIN85_09940 [Luteolibacter pohnpeiensis]|uniref:Carbohydrate-binding domain-containing protein n=1 Tax=Luteolibacter pohnpeiensis TaxID=454153 RepID=A0A934S8E7_9BACT|nr:hypothetical protein [Luteolibacter pohnpeiensis]MBK1882736.1 hypothetical protein [Luteolibacter pohnpeiensis]
MTRFRMLPASPWKKLSALAAPLIWAISSTQAAIPGAWETFPTQANADAWQVYDFNDGFDYIPDYNDSESGGKFIEFQHIDDEPLIFYADYLPGDEALIGDYTEANVGAISCEIYIEDLDKFEYTDCTVYADGPAGLTTYYSEAFFYDQFDDDGWWKLTYSFDRPWYYFNDDDEFVQVADNSTFLHDVRRLEFGFYPREGTTAGAYAALDDVKLEPRLEPADLTTGVTDGAFTLSFTKLPAVSYDLEKLSSAEPFSWSTVSGQTGQTAPGTFAFSTPTDQQREIFRVSSEPIYTEIETDP